MAVTKTCPDCNQSFTYNPNPNFHDNRKYCDSCGARRKAEYEASQKNLQSNKPVFHATPKPVQSEPQDSMAMQIVRREPPHSLEIGKAGYRHKIYYGTVEELQTHLAMLKSANLFEEEIPTL